MNHFIEEKNKKLFLMIIFIIVFAILFEKFVSNFSDILAGLSYIFKVLTSFVIGFFIAFILDPSVKFVESKMKLLFKKKKKKTGKNLAKLTRLLSIFIVYIVTITCISLIIIYLIPAITESVNEFRNRLPEYTLTIEKALNEYNLTQDLNLVDELSTLIGKYISEKDNIMGLLTGFMSVTSFVINLIVAIIVSFYMLEEKEEILRGARKTVISLFSDKVSFFVLKLSNSIAVTFNRFFIGKAIDSLIIGVLAYIGFAILNLKYNLIFSVIIGVTNMIPYFGPFIGAIPVVVLVFLYEPRYALPVALFIFILQQFDGNILGPKILGNSINARPIWIIFAIIIGGTFWGVMGMFLAVPVFAVIQDMFLTFVNKKYDKRVLSKGGGFNE